MRFAICAKEGEAFALEQGNVLETPHPWNLFDENTMGLGIHAMRVDHDFDQLAHRSFDGS